MDMDLGKVPEPHQLSPATEPASIPTLDGWIESLMNCKQLAESDVQRLCDRVGDIYLYRKLVDTIRWANLGRVTRLERYCRMSQTCNQWYGLSWSFSLNAWELIL